MSTMWLARVIEKSDTQAQLEILQLHPDAGDWNNFRELWLARAVVDGAFHEDGEPTGKLGEVVGSAENFYDEPVEALDPWFEVETKVIRDTYDDDNRKERLVEAGLDPTAELFPEVVEKICGRLQVRLKAKSPEWIEHLQVGDEWEF